MCFAATECLITCHAPSDLFVEEQRTGVYSNSLKYIGFLIEKVGLNTALSLKQYFSIVSASSATEMVPSWQQLEKHSDQHNGVVGNVGTSPAYHFLTAERVFSWLGPCLSSQSSCQPFLNPSSLGNVTHGAAAQQEHEDAANCSLLHPTAQASTANPGTNSATLQKPWCGAQGW